jgi:hypothetical protein
MVGYAARLCAFVLQLELWACREAVLNNRLQLNPAIIARLDGRTLPFFVYSFSKELMRLSGPKWTDNNEHPEDAAGAGCSTVPPELQSLHIGMPTKVPLTTLTLCHGRKHEVWRQTHLPPFQRQSFRSVNATPLVCQPSLQHLPLPDSGTNGHPHRMQLRGSLTLLHLRTAAHLVYH